MKMGCKMLDDKAMYDDARLSKLKELRRLMVELELEGMDGGIDTEKLEEALEEASGGGMADAEEASEGEEGEEMAAEKPEEDPLAIARRKFFKPEKKMDRSPGTAVMIAMQSKKPMYGKKGMKA